MEVNQSLISSILKLLSNEIIPAEGCTEPIAIAYATAKAVEVLGKKPEKISLSLSGNIIKNVKSVVVPNSDKMTGIAVSAAMGAFAGDASKELMVISTVTDEQLSEVKRFLATQSIHIQNSKNNLKLYIKVKVSNGDDIVSVEMKHSHTNITEIIKNDEVIHKSLTDAVMPEDAAKMLTIQLIYDVAKAIDTNLVKDLLEAVIMSNNAISQ